MRAAKYVGALMESVFSNNIISYTIPPLSVDRSWIALRLEVLFNYNCPKNYPSGLFCLRNMLVHIYIYIYILNFLKILIYCYLTFIIVPGVLFVSVISLFLLFVLFKSTIKSTIP